MRFVSKWKSALASQRYGWIKDPASNYIRIDLSKIVRENLISRTCGFLFPQRVILLYQTFVVYQIFFYLSYVVICSFHFFSFCSSIVVFRLFTSLIVVKTTATSNGKKNNVIDLKNINGCFVEEEEIRRLHGNIEWLCSVVICSERKKRKLNKMYLVIFFVYKNVVWCFFFTRILRYCLVIFFFIQEYF